MMMNGFPTTWSATLVLLFLCSLRECVGEPPEMNLTVRVTSADAEAITFDTGIGIEGKDNTVEIKVYDKCKFASSEQTLLGIWYPPEMATDVEGLGVDMSEMNQATGTGPGNRIPWDFLEGIETNNDIFTRFNDSHACLDFCVQVGLFVDGTMANWDELEVFVPMDMTMGIGEGDDDGLSITLSASESFFEAYEFNFTLEDGALNAYFCDPVTHDITQPGTTAHQGSVISICFNVADGQQFEVDDIKELYVADSANSGLEPEPIVVDSEVAAAGYGEKRCEWTTPTVRTCIASFLLKASFFDYAAISLTGYGAIKLELGDGEEGGEAGRRGLVAFGTTSNAANHRKLQRGDTGVAGFEVAPQVFNVRQETTEAPESAAACFWSSWDTVWMGLTSILAILV